MNPWFIPRQFTKLLVCVMAKFYRRFRPIFDCLWRFLHFLYSYLPFKGFFSAITRCGRSALGWGEKPGSPNEPEIHDENEPKAAGWQRCDRREDEEEEEEFDGEEYRVETTDEFYCSYDSTWETEKHQGNSLVRSRSPAVSRCYKFNRFHNAARDMQNYRHDYPIRQQRWNQDESSDDKPNLDFYLGKRPCEPDYVYIESFHNNWKKDYAALEQVHTYIQWLFPLQEPGMNYQASTLTKEEIQDFLRSDTAKENLLKSYELMLDFYGIELCDKKTGEVQRAPHWEERFYNLNNHTHNNLRITRILKCLGTLGYPHYQAPLVHFFLEQTLVHGELPNIKDSVLNYFVFAVLDKKQRRKLIHFAYSKYDRKDEFVWCPRKIQMMWSGPPPPPPLLPPSPPSPKPQGGMTMTEKTMAANPEHQSEYSDDESL